MYSMTLMRTKIPCTPQKKGKKGHAILVIWDPVEGLNVRLTVLGPRHGVLESKEVTPKGARKLARALLRAANEVEGRPVPKLYMEDDIPGQVIQMEKLSPGR